MILTSTSAAATSPSPELPPSVHPQSAITTTRAGTNTSGGRLHRQTAHKAIERTTDFCIKIDDEGEDEGGIYEPDASIERHDSEVDADDEVSGSANKPTKDERDHRGHAAFTDVR